MLTCVIIGKQPLLDFRHTLWIVAHTISKKLNYGSENFKKNSVKNRSWNFSASKMLFWCDAGKQTESYLRIDQQYTYQNVFLRISEQILVPQLELISNSSKNICLFLSLDTEIDVIYLLDHHHDCQSVTSHLTYKLWEQTSWDLFYFISRWNSFS